MSSKRFHPSPLSKWLVPVVLALLAGGLFAILVLVGLSVLGIKPVL
jgi:hypothetical protein